MPLDTRPQTPARQAMMVGVLALCFIASLAFAQYLVVHPRPVPVAEMRELPFVPPAGFVRLPRNPSFGELQPEGTYVGKVQGSPRMIYFFELPAKPGKVRDLQDLALGIYQAVSEGHGDTAEFRKGPLGGLSGVDVRGELKDKPGFVMVRAAYVPGGFVAVVYTGLTAMTDGDQDVFENAVRPGGSDPSNI